jgi:hypothetical protein
MSGLTIQAKKEIHIAWDKHGQDFVVSWSSTSADTVVLGDTGSDMYPVEMTLKEAEGVRDALSMCIADIRNNLG